MNETPPSQFRAINVCKVEDAHYRAIYLISVMYNHKPALVTIDIAEGCWVKVPKTSYQSFSYFSERQIIRL